MIIDDHNAATTTIDLCALLAQALSDASAHHDAVTVTMGGRQATIDLRRIKPTTAHKAAREAIEQMGEG